MQVLLLATVEEQKLPPLTDATPGPLLPILNQPVMARTIEILARAGHKRLQVSLCHAGGRIIAGFGNGKRWGVAIDYITQRQPWGTAGALRWAGHLLHETTLVLPADAILDLDIAAALDFHTAQQSMATMILHAPVAGYPAGAVRLGPDQRVVAISSEPDAQPELCSTGAYIIEPELLEHIPVQTMYDTDTQLLPALLEREDAVYGYRMPGYWNPLHSFASYQEAQRVFLHSACDATLPAQADPTLPRVRYPSIEGRQIVPGVWAGANHRIHPEARLVPPVCIGAGSWIGRAATVGPETVLGAHLMIDAEATVQHSTILEDAYVGQLVNLSHRIVQKTTIIDPHSSESVEVVDPFLLAVNAEPASRRGARITSFAIALLLLLVTLPLFLLISLIIYLVSDQSVFERTTAVGGQAQPSTSAAATQPLHLLAFRTRQADGSLTPIGRWLTTLGLARLPELWNVLTGDLALIGVKPLHPAEAARLDEEWHQKRFDHPAGLTGLWYVQTDSQSSLDDVLVVDAYYAATHTWRDDLAILWQTPAAWLRRRRTAWRALLQPATYHRQTDEVNS
jgi:NDP-sugar pyrophosphorylase family protein